jgi:hypothetical protein
MRYSAILQPFLRLRRECHIQNLLENCRIWPNSYQNPMQFDLFQYLCGGPLLTVRGVLSKTIQQGGGLVLGVLSQMTQKGGGAVLAVLGSKYS